jgi:predicted aspartyl protease
MRNASAVLFFSALALGLSPAGSTPVPEAEPGPVYAVPTTRDQAGRVLAPVLVNGQGPFRFILDTGANRSVLSLAAAARLHLQPSPDHALELHGVTGSAVLPAVRVGSVQIDDFVVTRNTWLPVLPPSVLADADGILGIEGLDEARIEVDFASDRVTIERSAGRRREPGALLVRVSLRKNNLLLADAQIGKVRAAAIIDTGAERTLGNLALRDALGLARFGKDERAITTVFGATPELGAGMSLIAPTIYIGDARLRNLEVTFGDLYVFTLWQLESTPALLVGMDLLGTLQKFVIDYRRREIQLVP